MDAGEEEQLDGRKEPQRPAASARRAPAEQTLRTQRFGIKLTIAERLLTSTNVASIVAFASSHSTVLNVLTSVQS